MSDQPNTPDRAPGSPPDAAELARALAVREGLIVEAGRAETRPALIFHMLNETARFVPYDRAVLLDRAGANVRVAGVSGLVQIDAQSPAVNDWQALSAALPAPETPCLLTPETLPPDTADAWDRLQARTGALSILWLPLVIDGEAVAGVWLERWREEAWGEAELRQLLPLAAGYAGAWRIFLQSRLSVRNWWRRHATPRNRVVAALLLLLLTFLPVRLRIVAPCEVVPDSPHVITAPLDGVIDRVLVEPGDRVEAGTCLARYDKDVALEELKVAEQQVAVMASELRRIRDKAFDDEDARAEMSVLTHRLAQEKTRLALARWRANQLDVRAGIAGTVVLDDPASWRGRPVQQGERILLLVQPRRSKLRIWLPQEDKIPLSAEAPVTVLLNADPAHGRNAVLRFVSIESRLGPDGHSGFPAEAAWASPDESRAGHLGLHGVAMLYGDRVPLIYWLLRKPWAWIRCNLGV